MFKLFSKEKAVYLAKNPSKMGFSWFFLLAGIVAGYVIHKFFGDSRVIILIIEKFTLLVVSILFIFIRKFVEIRVRAGSINTDSSLIYLTLPAGYVFVFLFALWITHMYFGFDSL